MIFFRFLWGVICVKMHVATEHASMHDAYDIMQYEDASMHDAYDIMRYEDASMHDAYLCQNSYGN